jgi:hypothetical protein
MFLSHVPFNSERFVAILATGTWLAIGGGFVTSVITSQSLSYYSYLLAMMAVSGIVGCVMYFTAVKSWRFVLGCTAGAYLILFCFQFLITSTYFQLDDLSLLDALKNGLFYRWKLIEHLFLNFLYWDGIAIVFYEWLMPMCQFLIVFSLVHPLTLWTTGNRR